MPFQQDLGYLWKFFDNVESFAQAQGLDDLSQFAADERVRWQAIAPLLQDDAPRPPERPAAPSKKPPADWTVGSLIDNR